MSNYLDNNDKIFLTDLFKNYSINQRISIFNFILISISNGDINESKNKINDFYDILGVNFEQSKQYNIEVGVERIFNNLSEINQEIKEIIIYTIWTILKIDGHPSDEQIANFAEYSEIIGISNSNFVKLTILRDY